MNQDSHPSEELASTPTPVRHHSTVSFRPASDMLKKIMVEGREALDTRLRGAAGSDLSPITGPLPSSSLHHAETAPPAFIKSGDSIPIAGPRGDAPGGAVYTLGKLVGRGGCGEVWEAIQPTLGRVIAVKRIREDIYERVGFDTGHMRRLEGEFVQEALTTAGLEHPNIVPVYDLGVDERGRPLIPMKLVRGKPWDEMIDDDQSMPMAEYLDKHLPILVDMAQAVAFAHSRGIVHRDIKPAQVMVGEFGEVLLMDWGLSMVYDQMRMEATMPDMASIGTAPSRDSATNPAGTPAFMSPEQTEKTTANLGPWTDIFLLGGTLYYMLTGTPPYMAPSAEIAMFRASMGEIEPPRRRAPARDIPPELEDIALRAMEREPRDRIPSATAFVEEIRGYITGAGKRRESRSLTEQVSFRLEHDSLDYGTLSECDSLLLRAIGLWPQNEAAKIVRQLVLSKFVEAALENQDLVLARIQAGHIEEEETRTEFLNEIHALEKLSELSMEEAEESERALATSENRRRALERELAQARESHRSALASRDKAEEAMIVLLNVLKEQAGAEVGNAVPLVARQLGSYFESLNQSEFSAESLHRRMLAFRTLGQLFLDRGDVEDCVASFRKAFAAAERLVMRSPDNENWRRELRQCQRDLARVNA